MSEQFAALLERYLNIPPELTLKILQRLLVGLAAAFFVLMSTITVAFNNLFSINNIAMLGLNDVATQDITAPNAATFTSVELTNQARNDARDSVLPVYDPPDPNVARQQTDLAREILDFINNVRRDNYATEDQQISDINQITALALEEAVIRNILRMDDEPWQAVADEIVAVIQRTMRENPRPSDIERIREQNLPTQVSVSFNPQERDVIVAVAGDLIRPNTFENPEKTEDAREAAASAVPDIERRFGRGQTIVQQGDVIDAVAYEALEQLGLLTPEDLRLESVGRALLASIVTMIVIGLYIARFEPQLIYLEPRRLTMLATFFLLILLATRILGINTDQIYLFPTAMMALVYVSLAGPRIAIIASLGLAMLVGLMMSNSLEGATLTAAGGIIGTLSLRRPERFNSFFVAGVLVGLMNVAVIAIFNMGGAATATDLVGPVVIGFLNGAVLVPMTAFALMFLFTMLFNLPTPFKLLELSQPNKPLLQRLLREAPGTYQHSLQVANLAEQAATAIGADAQMTHVAALYHDIGKLVEPVFFSENQQGIANPHDTLNDPYRSAAVIISHVTEGDEMARQHHLPSRIRDFIREHHGTTQVFVFYQRAIQAAGGDESAVDLEDFTYPGPKPQSRETAILMLADSCESAVRAVKPESRQEIRDLVHKIIDDKRRHGQLHESHLSLNDLEAIERIFIEILQTLNHPRIDYRKAVAVRSDAPKAKSETSPKPPPKSEPRVPKVKRTATTEMEAVKENATNSSETDKPAEPEPAADVRAAEKPKPPVVDDDDAPMPEVPPLPRTTPRRQANGGKSSLPAADVKPDNSSEETPK